MHIEILVEDDSGKKMLEILVPKLIGEYSNPHTWNIIGYKGIGHIPKGLQGKTDANKRVLLDRLPKLLAGYSNTPHIDAVVVVVDVDNRDCKAFLQELQHIAQTTPHPLNIMFRLAIEEIEAWYLGDKEALFAAYPHGRRKQDKLRRYQQDSICGTWETLADIIYPKGSFAMKEKREVGTMKYEWAEKITPFMDPERNQSPSFVRLRDGLRKLVTHHPPYPNKNP